MQEETINKIVEIIEKDGKNIPLSIFLKILGEFFTQEDEENIIEPTLWNFPEYLTQKLTVYFESISITLIPESSPLSL